MLNCRQCGYLVPESWLTCKRCHAPLAAPAPAPAFAAAVAAGATTPVAPSTGPSGTDDIAAPAGWVPPMPFDATPTATAYEFTPSPAAPASTSSRRVAAGSEWWRERTVPLALTGLGFACVLISAFALPWMHFGGVVHAGLSYNQTRDFLAKQDSFTQFALNLGAFIMLADLLLVGWRLSTTGRIGREAIAPPIGVALLVLYVANEVRGLAVQFNDLGIPGALGIRASVGTGPWVCLLGCVLLLSGGLLGPNAN